MLFARALEHAGAIEVDDDRDGDDQDGPPDHGDVRFSRLQTIDGLPHDPSRRAEKQPRFDKRRDAFSLGVTVMVRLVRRLVGIANSEESDRRRPDVEQAVNRLGEYAERSGNQGGGEFGGRQAGAGGQRNQGNLLLFRGHRRPSPLSLLSPAPA